MADLIISIIGCVTTVVFTMIGTTWFLAMKLGKIETQIVKAVTHEQCSEKREKCPCVKDMESIKNKLNFI